MSHLFWLSDKAWARIEPLLPHGKPGKPRVDDRRVISGILHVLKTGCRWRDAPAAYGPPSTIYNRFYRWTRRGLWRKMLEQITASGAAPAELMLDSTDVKAHQLGSWRKGGASWRSGRRGAGGPQKSIVWPMVAEDRLPSR